MGDQPAEPVRTVGEVLGHFLDAAHRVPPDLLPDLIAMAAAGLGAHTCRVWLADHQQRGLVHLAAGPAQAEPERISIDGSFGGRAFVSSAVVEGVGDGNGDGGVHLWCPLLDGVDRIGVLELHVADLDDERRRSFRHLASMAAAEIITRGQYTDRFTVVRRTREMSLAAELQWQGLPPTSFRTSDVAVAGMLEPAYDVGGDTFDYAHATDTLDFMIIDAVGHSVEASTIASIAQGVYRNQRRAGADLPTIATSMDGAIREQFQRSAFATGQLGRLETTTGTLRWLNAGHPLPILIRGSHVEELQCRPRLPFGWNHMRPGAEWTIAEEQLEPGDGVLFFTDGVIEVHEPGGEEFGIDRLKDFVHAAVAAGLAPAETLRRLSHAILDFHGDQLRDDATTFMLTWRPSDIS